MSFKKYPLFTVLNVIVFCGGIVGLVLIALRKGFISECPSTGFIVSALYAICGYMMGTSLVGLLSIGTRSKITVYFYKALLFLSFVAALAFVFLAVALRIPLSEPLLAFSWGRSSSADICAFQKDFGCNGWSNPCIPKKDVDGCPSCTFSPSATANNTNILPTCKTIFHDIFSDGFIPILIGAGAFVLLVIVMNVTAYCAARTFSYVAVAEQEHLINSMSRMQAPP